MADLAAFLNEQAVSDAPWNCSTMPSDWCVANDKPDFAAAWRGTVDPSECDAASEGEGGLLALWDRDIGDGLPTIGNPARGDIGVVEALGQQTGAIFTGERWAVRGSRTLHFLGSEQVRVLKAWRL